jgi:hypothetical protein
MHEELNYMERANEIFDTNKNEIIKMCQRPPIKDEWLVCGDSEATVDYTK